MLIQLTYIDPDENMGSSPASQKTDHKTKE